MPKSKILIVDDETSLTELLSMRLKSLGFDASGVANGKAALDFVESTPPDLILLDIMMPGMDGYEVAERLHKNPKTSLIPIIMLTAKKSRDDKIKSLKMGIDDYITKPFDKDELVARINAVLRRTKKGAPGAAALSPEEEKRIEFLRKMVEEKVGDLKPEYNMTSLSGYGYPYAAGFFRTTDGSEANDLSFLAEKGCLAKKFFDKILVCPYCYHHDINIREVCPADRSANIKITEMINHFRCGFVGPEEEFRQDIRYVCPKCKAELRQIGLDYDKPGQSYICNENGEKFTEPLVYCQCRNCKKFFDVDKASRQDIFLYSLTQRGKEAAGSGRFAEVNLEQALIDEEVDLYNLRYFKKQFADETERAKKFKRAFSLVLVAIPDFDSVTKKLGLTEAQAILKEIASILKSTLLGISTPARYDKNSFIALLPETGKKEAEESAKAVKEKVEELKKKGLKVRISVASYPGDSATEDGLIERLLKQ